MIEGIHSFWAPKAIGKTENPEMPTIQIDPMLTLFYEDQWFGDPWNQPEVVLLIHGISESSRAWFGWVPCLSRDLRVLRPDWRGFPLDSPSGGLQMVTRRVSG